MTTILEDTREIIGVFFSDDSGHRLGECGVEKIEAYAEPQIYCNTASIAIWKGGEIHTRIPAYMVQIVYK